MAGNIYAFIRARTNRIELLMQKRREGEDVDEQIREYIDEIRGRCDTLRDVLAEPPLLNVPSVQFEDLGERNTTT